MATLDSMLDLVMPWTPKATAGMAKMMILRAAIEFCRRSRIDRVALASFNTVAGTPEYNLVSPDSAKVVYEARAVYLDDDVDPLTNARTDDEPASDGAQDRPQYYLCRPGSKKLVLIATPNGVYAVKARVVLEPATDATTLDDWIVARHGEAIAHGAISRLLSMPKKPWTDYAASAGYKGMFDSACIAAQGEADRGNTNAPIRTRSVFGMK